MAYYLKALNDRAIKRKVKYRAGESAWVGGCNFPAWHMSRADRFSGFSEKQHKTSVSYYLKSIKHTFLNCSQCTYVNCLLSSEKFPWPAIQGCGINRLDVSNSCPSYTTAVTRFAGSATWKSQDRWHQGQQGSWSTLWSLPLFKQAENAGFFKFCLIENA